MNKSKAWNIKKMPVRTRQQIAGEAKKQGLVVSEFIVKLWDFYESEAVNAQRMDEKLEEKV